LEIVAEYEIDIAHAGVDRPRRPTVSDLGTLIRIRPSESPDRRHRRRDFVHQSREFGAR
jgi:hypothetical protein